MRLTPFRLAFGEIGPRRFPAIAEALRQDGGPADDRDSFTLLEPVGRLLRDLVPEASGADELEGHVLLLHQAFLYWANGAHLYRIGEAALRRAVAESRLSSQLPQRSVYLQLPELRMWGAPQPGTTPEPLDGMFVSRTPSGSIAVLAIFGVRPDRPGFSAVGIEGHADTAAATLNEVEVAATREDGSPAFGPILAGGTAAGLHSVANPAELLLLTCRLLALLPPQADASAPDDMGESLERVVTVD
jgi:hypothetical protein